MEIELTKSSFNEEVMESDKPVLIDFWASWCGPCRMQSPVISEVAEAYAGQVKVCKVNVTEEEELAAEFKVMSIPTLVVIKDKKLITSVMGFKSRKEIDSLLGSVT